MGTSWNLVDTCRGVKKSNRLINRIEKNVIGLLGFQWVYKFFYWVMGSVSVFTIGLFG